MTSRHITVAEVRHQQRVKERDSVREKKHEREREEKKPNQQRERERERERERVLQVLVLLLLLIKSYQKTEVQNLKKLSDFAVQNA